MLQSSVVDNKILSTRQMILVKSPNKIMIKKHFGDEIKSRRNLNSIVNA